MDVWFDTQQIEAGQDFADRIQRAMRERDVFIRVCTVASQRSYWVQLETNAFRGLVAEDHARGRGDTRVLINVILDAEYERQPFDYATLFIDATNAPQDVWLAQLRRALGVPEPAPLPIVVAPPAPAKPALGPIRQAPPVMAVALSAQVPAPIATNSPLATPKPQAVPTAAPNPHNLPPTIFKASTLLRRAFTSTRMSKSNRLIAGVGSLVLALALSGFALALAYGATDGSTAQRTPTATNIATFSPTGSSTPASSSSLPLPMTCDQFCSTYLPSVQLTGATNSLPQDGQNTLAVTFTVTCASAFGPRSACPNDALTPTNALTPTIELGDTIVNGTDPVVTSTHDYGVFTIAMTFTVALQQGVEYKVALWFHLSQPATDCAFVTTSFVAPAPSGA